MPIRRFIQMGRGFRGDERTRATRVETIAEHLPLALSEFGEGSRSDHIDNSGSPANTNANRSSRICTGNRKKQSGNPTKKSVRWSTKLTKRRHIQIKDMKEEERESVWYTPEDTKIILAMAKVTVKMMMNGDYCDNIDYCSRGLEGKTSRGARQRIHNKQRVRTAVLEEQKLQRTEGLLDADALARVSLKYSEDLAAQARDKALGDERDARAFLLGVRTIGMHLEQQDILVSAMAA